MHGNVDAGSPREGDGEPLSLEFGGNTHLLPRRGNEFYKQTSDLFKNAGFTGTVRVRVLNTSKVRMHEGGVHVHAPTASGIPIDWQSDNNLCIRMVLRKHQGKDSAELYNLLKNPLTLEVQTQKGEQDVANPMSGEEALAKILGEGNSSSNIEMTLETSHPIESDQHKDVKKSLMRGQGVIGAFTSDSINIELFLSEIAAKANEKGEVSTVECVNILRTDFGFPPGDTGVKAQQNAPYAVLYTLSKRAGILEKIDLGYRIPPEKFHQLRTASTNEGGVTTQPAEVTEDSVLESSEVSEASAEATGDVQTTSSIEPTEFTKKFEALEERVKKIRSRRQWLVDLDRELAVIVSQQQSLEERRKTLEEEMRPIKEALQHPQAAEDEAAYGAIVQLMSR